MLDYVSDEYGAATVSPAGAMGLRKVTLVKEQRVESRKAKQ